MKSKSLLLFLLCIHIHIQVLAQSGKETSVPLFFEKAYLHTDRDVYGQGEDIWYKAYVVNAQNNEAINYSHNLYAELISPDAKIVSREMIRLENGLGNGDFKLSDSIPAGQYRLRAYTNWMRNFGDNFIFEKNITVLETNDASAVATKNKKTASKSAATATLSAAAPATSTLPVVRFFPEGGDLVNGLSSIVGIKAEDGAGNGVMASGRVVDNAGGTVAEFSCDSLGFGSMALLPLSGQHYQALVMIHGKQQRFILPDVRSTGFGLQLHYLGLDTVKAVISAASAAAGGQHLYLVARHGGKSYVRQAVVLNGNRMVVAIPYPLLPEGISEITLYDEQNQPQCERLVYIHHPDNKNNSVRIISDKKSYQPKEQVNLIIHAQPNSNLSLAVVDAGAVTMQREDIVSYLQLQSEIKGTIESPKRYFDTTNVNRFKQLDLLLLTQGWRNFVWKRIEDTTLKITYEPEQGISITGRVRRVGANKPLPGISVTMHAPKAEGQKLFWATTDSAGRFSIYDTKFYGYQYLSFTSRKSGKINQSGESKGATGGYIQVDSLLRDTLAVHPAPIALQADTSWRANQWADAEIERIRESLKLKADHNLKEVTIKAHTSKLYTRLPPEVHPITLVEQKEYDNLAQYLSYMVEGSSITSDSCYWCIGSPGILSRYVMQGEKRVPVTGVYVDKSPIDYCHLCQEQYLNLPMSDILKVTINRVEDVYGKQTSVAIVMRPGVLDTKDYFDNTMADMVGYYKAREFYKPRLDNTNAIDLRTNTIYWEPNIISDEKGSATLSFYNTAQTGKMRLIAEGIAPDGTPIVATVIYEVK